jgi:hypothetical protein
MHQLLPIILCSFTVHYLNDLASNEGNPAATTEIIAGCYIGEPPTPTFAGVKLDSVGANSTLLLVAYNNLTAGSSSYEFRCSASGILIVF